MKRLLGLAVALCLSTACLAQQAPPVATYGSPANSGNSSSTIASTNVWQKVYTAAPTPDNPRKSCLVLNQGVHEMWVYFQGPGMAAPSGTGSEPSAIPLNAAAGAGQAGGWVTCNVGGAVLQDTIWVTGTSGDAYVATQQ